MSFSTRTFKTNKIYILAQILIFTGLAASQSLPLFWGMKMPSIYWIKQVILMLMWASAFYLTLKLCMPRLLFKARPILFFLSMILLIFGFVTLNHHVDGWLDYRGIMNAHFHVDPKDDKPEKDLIGHFWIVILTLLVIGSATIIGIGKKLRDEALVREDLEREKLESELSFLKAQVNPHFFFNVLNSIYALTGENTQAQEAVYNLSRLMRHVLYGTKQQLVLLSKEVNFMEDYLKLMKLRLTENVLVTFEKPDDLQEAEAMPMLFLPFIENAFKHGVSSLHPSYIHIKLEQHEHILEFDIKNSMFPDQPTDKEESNGIGLVNSQRRLDLIYPQKYSLSAKSDENQSEFSVHLKLDLS
ncbi:histidine kinase [Flavobacterium sp.]|uniref:sensor histidine kinase n=1 Tax=Flavobacterium sp. TaxID=239 RepID=UPI001223F4F4|nr:histidine kinase [Flavobacterium sp.]RZJ69879.1 MAG: sensor histidine kinase [Flavobacterium sp.]